MNSRKIIRKNVCSEKKNAKYTLNCGDEKERYNKMDLSLFLQTFIPLLGVNSLQNL